MVSYIDVPHLLHYPLIIIYIDLSLDIDEKFFVIDNKKILQQKCFSTSLILLLIVFLEVYLLGYKLLMFWNFRFLGYTDKLLFKKVTVYIPISSV